MNGEVIEVCQDCGYVIEPETVRAPWGTSYRITLCMRAECLMDRLRPDPDLFFEADRKDHLRPFAFMPPVITDPRAPFRITVV